MSKTVQDIAQLIDGKVVGDGSLAISGITNIENLQDGHITFINDEKYLPAVEDSGIACIIATPEIASSKKTLIHHPYPKLDFAHLLTAFFPKPQPKPGVSKNISLGENVTLGKNLSIADFVVIEDGASMAGCYIGPNVSVGNHSTIYPNAVIYYNCKVGNNVTLFANCVIGSDGFGFVNTGKGQFKVPQVGNVVLEDDVEIGACTTIDRATMGSTIIHRGVKLDNLVQVAHNVEIGEHTVASSFTGISGSTKIGKNCTIAGGVGLADHCTIGDNVILCASAGIPSKKKISDGQVFLGSPARPIEQAKKQFGAIAVLPRIIDKVSKLEKRIKELENK